jgi:hypothetical protein
MFQFPTRALGFGPMLRWPTLLRDPGLRPQTPAAMAMSMLVPIGTRFTGTELPACANAGMAKHGVAKAMNMLIDAGNRASSMVAASLL